MTPAFRARFTSAEEELNVFLTWAFGHQKKISGFRKSLERTIEHWSSPEGGMDKKQLIDAADSPYMIRREAAVASLARELRRKKKYSGHGK